VAPPAPEPARVVEAAHDLWLSPSQFSTLAHALRSASLGASGSLECGAAGYRLLPAAAFVDVVHRLSVAGKLPPLWARLPPSALWQLASDFGARDGGGSAGLVDWQAFCVSVSVTGGEGQGGVTPSGAAVGACIPRWMTASESKELEQAFAAKDDAASGFVPATSCADVAFWFESERQSAAVTVRAGAVHDSVGGACVRDVGAGWHNVAVDFATRDTWRAHEADRMAASASALVAHQQDQVCVLLLLLRVGCACSWLCGWRDGCCCLGAVGRCGCGAVQRVSAGRLGNRPSSHCQRLRDYRTASAVPVPARMQLLPRCAARCV
jgi:hypothetical protein